MKIALMGTFDVDNYGDLLFPYIAQYRLPEHDLTFVSPTNSTTTFRDAKNVISFAEAERIDFDLIVIGGGNIIHTQCSGLETYAKVGTYAYPQLWIGAAKMAIRKNIPYVFNTPSISRLHASGFDRVLFRNVFDSCSYISLREQYSKKFAQQFTDKKIDCVPDSAIELSRVWPYEQKIEKKIVINLNERYHAPISHTASLIEKIAKTLDLNVEIIIIGDCHGDLDFSKKVMSHIHIENKKIIEQQSLKSLAHTIAGASYFIGSSMHGFITALSYKVPCLLVLDENPMHKFPGLIDEVNLDRNVICSNWEEALSRLAKPAMIDEKVWGSINSRLCKHWSTIRDSSASYAKIVPTFPIQFWRQLIWIDRRTRKIRKGIRLIFSFKRK